MAKTLSKIFGQERQLKTILSKISYYEKISIEVKKILPEILHTHVRIGGIKNNVLVLFAGSSAYAIQMGYHLPRIKQHLSVLFNLPDLRVQTRVDPEMANLQNPPLRIQKLKPSTAMTEHLNALCDCISYPPLKNVISKMLKNK